MSAPDIDPYTCGQWTYHDGARVVVCSRARGHDGPHRSPSGDEWAAAIHQDAYAALRAENTRLRQALEQITHYTDRRRTGPNVEQQVACGHVTEVVTVARAALAEEPRA